MASLREYKKCCERVWNRASGVCEILVEGERCRMYIPFEDCKYINFAHRAGRMGKSQEWVNDPDNIFFSCSSHHIEEESTGVRMEGVEYDDEIVYVPCED